MSAEDKVSKFEPEYPASLHPDVISECRDAWMKGRPWTKIRALREGVDVSEGSSCANACPSFHLACPKTVEGVQYTSPFGDPQFYCEGHALEQIEWDRAHYDSQPKPWRHEFSPEEQREIERIVNRGKKRKEETELEVEP